MKRPSPLAPARFSGVEEAHRRVPPGAVVGKGAFAAELSPRHVMAGIADDAPQRAVVAAFRHDAAGIIAIARARGAHQGFSVSRHVDALSAKAGSCHAGRCGGSPAAFLSTPLSGGAAEYGPAGFSWLTPLTPLPTGRGSGHTFSSPLAFWPRRSRGMGKAPVQRLTGF